MALCTLSTAWCSYQSARWSAASARNVRASEAAQRRAIALHLEGNQVITVQAQMFMQWINAHLAGDEKLAQFYSARFGPELKKAHTAWMAQEPFERTNAAPHPFVAPLYEARFVTEGTAALEQAARKSGLAASNTRTGAQYLSNTVLFATVLFFAGMSGKFDQRRVRAGTMVFAFALFVWAAIRISSLPAASPG